MKHITRDINPPLVQA